MDEKSIRVTGILIGDLKRQPGPRTKYGDFFDAIDCRFTLVETYNASLPAPSRWLNALMAFHWDQKCWREQFYKNPWAFRMRSRRVARHLRSVEADIALQIGTLFDAKWKQLSLPSIIYTDYTAHLSAQHPDTGRSPLTRTQLAQWLALEHQAYQRADHICTRSLLVRDSLVSDYNIDPDKVTVIGGGLNLPELPTMEMRSKKGMTALFIGKDCYRKGGDQLLKAFAQVRHSLPEARLLLVTGDDIPPQLPLENVEIIPSTWDRETITALYQRADVFVLPSRLETWGDVLIEAMAYGLPCIGVTGEAMGEIIEPGVTGMVVAPDDAELADALITLLRDEGLRHKMGQAGRGRVEAAFTWNHVVEQLAAIIEKTLASSTKERGSQ